MTVEELEKAVQELERIRIVVRLPKRHRFPAESYNHQNAFQKDNTLQQLVDRRLAPKCGEDTELVFISGRGLIPQRNMVTQTLRDSYGTEAAEIHYDRPIPPTFSNIREFEEVIWNRERIRIVFRKPSDSPLPITEYLFGVRASDDDTLSDYVHQKLLHHRMANLFELEDIVVVDGTGSTPHGNTKLSTVRRSYRR